MVDSDSKFLNENSELTEREKDYREWLAESEELHRGAHFNLKAEIETEDELEDVGGVRTPSIDYRLKIINNVFKVW